MKYVDEFRDPTAAARLADRIRQTSQQRWTLMEVCGGQTHSLLRHGIEEALSEAVELIHGPGCPVCVTPVEAIDHAQRIATSPDTLLTSFGDMLRVPGTERRLLDVRASGGQVRMVYSPLDAVEIARQQPETNVVFFAVGFETTAPATALAILQAERSKLSNFSVLSAHVRVLPAMEAIASDPAARVQAFLAAGHVCTVAGYSCYQEFVERYRLPVVVTGFEPVDLLTGIEECVRQLEAGEAKLTNRYGRVAQPEGNPSALQLMDRVFQVSDQPWRGLGIIPGGGLQLRPEWSAFDARQRFPNSGQPPTALEPHPLCESGAVLTGRIKPSQCASFGTRCTPQTPLGAPMVSSEGACAAYYRYRGTQQESFTWTCPTLTPLSLPAAASPTTDHAT